MIWSIAWITSVTKSFFCDILVTERYNSQSIKFLFFNITTTFISYYYTFTQIKLINYYWPLCQCSNLIVNSSMTLLRIVWRDQRGNQLPYIKNRLHNGEKKKYKKRSSNRSPTKDRGELRCSRRVCRSWCISGTRRVNIVTNPIISREWVKDRAVLTISGHIGDHCDTDIFYSGQPSHGGDHNICDDFTFTKKNRWFQ